MCTCTNESQICNAYKNLVLQAKGSAKIIALLTSTNSYEFISIIRNTAHSKIRNFFNIIP